ncbi:hypothetical protein B0H17DRAFT_1163663 [Mycena rosella]|uniref:Uncharacterized protein n=1 Tax=Mycena rosella TaxID=1033263 RepID=A0AAD7CLS6_MYCRO|nr:hypothetical protein B0H17DRAFT_1163663 [Mycena rosella]
MSGEEMNTDDVAAGGAVRRRGRGFQNTGGNEGTLITETTYDRAEASHVKGADTPVEGWIVLVTTIQEEATEEDGYVLVEYETMTDVQSAIDGASGTMLLEQAIQCVPRLKKGRGPRGRSASPSLRR